MKISVMYHGEICHDINYIYFDSTLMLLNSLGLFLKNINMNVNIYNNIVHDFHILLLSGHLLHHNECSSVHY